MRQGELAALVRLPLDPHEVAVDDARGVAGLLWVALDVVLAAELLLDLEQVPHEHEGVELGADLGHAVGHRRGDAIGRLGLVGMAHVRHAGQRDLVDELHGAREVGHAVAHIGAQAHEALARVLLGDGPVRVDGLRAAGDVVDAQDARAVGDRRDADALCSGVAVRRRIHARDGADEALAAHGSAQRVAHRDHRARGALDNHVLVGELVEARARVDADPVARDARPHEHAGLVAEEAHDLAHDRRLVGQGEAVLRNAAAHGERRRRAGRARVVELDLLARRRRTRAETGLVPVHDDAAALGLGGDLDHLRVGEAGHVVDDRGAKARADPGDVGVARIDRDDGPLGHERADHGDDAAGLLLAGDGAVTGARGLAAHVDDVGALVKHLQAVRDGGLRIEVLAAVRERVRRHVEDAHDARAREADLVFSAAPDGAVLPEHGRSSLHRIGLWVGSNKPIVPAGGAAPAGRGQRPQKSNARAMSQAHTRSAARSCGVGCLFTMAM